MANRSAGASAISRALRVLESFTHEAPFLSVTAIADRTGIPLSSAHRIVGELVGHQLLERMPDRTYRVGNRLFELGTLTPGAIGLREIALPYLHAVQSRVRQHVQLAVRSGLDVLVVERLSARDAAVNGSIIGGRVPLQHSAAGIVLLAAADDTLVTRVIRRGLEPLTPQGIQSEHELRAAVDSAHREGFAISAGRIFSGSRSLAVPVRGAEGAVVATLAIVEANTDDSPMARVNLLRRAADGISEMLTRNDLPTGHPDALPGGAYRSLVNSSDSSMEYLERFLRGSTDVPSSGNPGYQAQRRPDAVRPERRHPGGGADPPTPPRRDLGDRGGGTADARA